MATNNSIIEGFQKLGFRISDETIGALLKDATKRRLSAAQLCERVIEAEMRERDTRNLQSRSRAATLGSFKSIDQFDWNWPRSIDRALYEQLSTLDFIKRKQNILMRGQSGVGKSSLAKNLGLEALNKGYTVRFTTLASALADLLKQESLPALERRMKRYTAPSLWICDEIGYLPCDSRSADMLYNIIARRHENAATIITTNLGFKKWNTIFPGAACVSALVDRFVQHCHVLDIDADSWREKEAHEFAAKAAKNSQAKPPKRPKPKR